MGFPIGVVLPKQACDIPHRRTVFSLRISHSRSIRSPQVLYSNKAYPRPLSLSWCLGLKAINFNGQILRSNETLTSLAEPSLNSISSEAHPYLFTENAIHLRDRHPPTLQLRPFLYPSSYAGSLCTSDSDSGSPALHLSRAHPTRLQQRSSCSELILRISTGPLIMTSAQACSPRRQLRLTRLA